MSFKHLSHALNQDPCVHSSRLVALLVLRCNDIEVAQLENIWRYNLPWLLCVQKIYHSQFSNPEWKNRLKFVFTRMKSNLKIEVQFETTENQLEVKLYLQKLKFNLKNWKLYFNKLKFKLKILNLYKKKKLNLKELKID